jgi:hypothetical protein
LGGFRTVYPCDLVLIKVIASISSIYYYIWVAKKESLRDQMPFRLSPLHHPLDIFKDNLLGKRRYFQSIKCKSQNVVVLGNLQNQFSIGSRLLKSSGGVI